jgi:hypothetical protein
VVTALATTPVKGLRLCARQELVLSRDGVADNRRFFLVDERGKMVNGKRVGILAAVRADYDPTCERLTMRFPDGSCASDTVELGESLEVRFFSRTPTVQLVRGPWAQALSEYAGVPLRVVRGDGVDRGRAGAVSLISEASIARLTEVAGQTVDPRRFRMLVQVAGPSAHEEDSLVGGTVRIGSALVAIHGNVGRCLVTGQDPDTGVPDMATLELLAYRKPVVTTEPLAFGVFGEVLEPGAVRVGDAVFAERRG